MKKDLGVKPYTFPMPVLMIATYGENDKVDVMNMAWGGVCASNMVALNIGEDHKTTQNIKERMAFGNFNSPEQAVGLRTVFDKIFISPLAKSVPLC